jgi:GNAT superfamily N-acetyltransferase
VRDDDLLALQALASRTWSRTARHHPGQLAWSARHAGSTSDVVRIWREGGQGVDDSEVVGWAWAEEPDRLELCVDGAHTWATDVAREMVAWFLDQAPDGPTRTMVLASDHLLLTVLGEAGFVPEKAPWFTHHHLDLERLGPVPEVPGYRFREVRPGEAAPRAACHRAAWTPPGETSRVTTATYDVLMDTVPYRPDLDWVAIAPDGSWVASCLAWLDQETGVALLEPVGCAPDHRRRGLAAAVSLAALNAARAAGARQALVCPRGDQGHPAPGVLFRGLGFEPGERTVPLVRE